MNRWRREQFGGFGGGGSLSKSTNKKIGNFKKGSFDCGGGDFLGW